MKQYSEPQKSAPFLKIIFQVLHITWCLCYFFRLIFLPSLKLHPTLSIPNVKRFEFPAFRETSPEKIVSILKGLNPSKAAGIDNFSGKFLKDGAHVLARPISQLCNLSIKLTSFPRSCKIAKVKLLFKNSSKTDPQNYHPISFLSCYQKLLKGLFIIKLKSV